MASENKNIFFFNINNNNNDELIFYFLVPGPVLNLKIVDRKLHWDQIKDSGPVYYVLKIKTENGTITEELNHNYYSLEKFKDTHVFIKVCCILLLFNKQF